MGEFHPCGWKMNFHGWIFIHDDASDDKRHDVGHNVGDVICDTFHPKNPYVQTHKQNSQHACFS